MLKLIVSILRRAAVFPGARVFSLSVDISIAGTARRHRPSAGAAGAIGPRYFSLPSSGPIRSIGSGNTTVVFLSAPITVRVSR